jgi:hypothetical protein
MPNMDIHDVVVTHPRVAPNQIEQLPSAQHHARARRQRRQHVELRAGQHDRRAIQVYLPAVDVDLQGTELAGRANLLVGIRISWG